MDLSKDKVQLELSVCSSGSAYVQSDWMVREHSLALELQFLLESFCFQNRTN